MPATLRLGAHESIAGALHQAFERGEAHGAEAVQIFTKNARGWKARSLRDDEVADFRASAKRSGIASAAHASYLINLAAGDPEQRVKSLDALTDEVHRCDLLGVPLLIVHPGTHADEAHGLELIAQALLEVRGRRPESPTRILLENTAGQGSSLGHRFEQLQTILEAVGKAPWLGVCLDTCHLFAAGHDLSTPDGYRRTMESIDERVGLSRVAAFHLNDCKGPLGCRVDRHENIGKGKLGLAAFECLLNDARFQGLPAVLETEEGQQVENLTALRALVH